MHGPTDLLATWESGLAAGELQRAVLLHALARGEADGTNGLLDVPVGQRDRELFALRRTLFGERLNARVACAGCGEELEFDFDVANVLRTAGSAAGAVWVEAGEWRIRLRQPTSGDLLAVAGAGPLEAKRMLLGRCVLAAERAGQPADDRIDDSTLQAGLVDDLPAQVQAQVAVAAAEADPGADIRLDVPCVECGHRSKATMDIASYLWAELDVWARGILLDVHLLASAYGWNEAEVLALSPTRRRYYLELVGHA